MERHFRSVRVQRQQRRHTGARLGALLLLMFQFVEQDVARSIVLHHRTVFSAAIGD
jgi:hypothetical protein